MRYFPMPVAAANIPRSDGLGSPPAPRRSSRNHRVDLLRIVFASLVLLAHAPELIDGNRSRELLGRLTHTRISFGDLAVDGFFLLSGSLILQSWQRKPRLLDYLQSRCLRIVPGYVVAVALSVLVLGLAAPAEPHFFRGLGAPLVATMLALDSPATPPVCPLNPAWHNVDGALWTIGYEFRCYLLVALFGVAGLLLRRRYWLIATVLAFIPFLAGYSLRERLVWHRLVWLTGDPQHDMRLVPIFLLGGCYFLFARHIPLRPAFAVAALLALPLTARLLPNWEASLVIFGSYLLFYFCSAAPHSLPWMSRVPDISYGIYLYGWPVEMLWIELRRGGSPWIAALACAPICMALGWLSWHWVERPMLKLKRRPRVPLPAA